MSSRLLRIAVLAPAITCGALSWAPAAEPLLKASKIAIDPTGALVVDGRKLFPINLTIIPPPDAKTPSGKLAYEEFADGGVSFMRTGGPHWSEKTVELEQQYQAAAARVGMRCCPWLGWELSKFKTDDTRREQQLRDLLARFKDSPGLGLWKGADEPEWGRKSPAEVANTARIIREVDPNHPIWLVQAPRGTVASLKRYDAGWDIGGIDVYPVSYPPGRHSDQPNKELSMVGDFTRMMREVAGPKPFWMTLQIAFSGTTPPKGVLRFPSFVDQRFMAYEAIINGSRGLTFFGGGLLPTLNERDRKLGWNWTYWERVMKPLLQELGSHSPLQPALVAPDSQRSLTVVDEKAPRSQTDPAPTALEFMTREVGEDFYLFACKKEGTTSQVRFAGLPTECSTGQVVFEEPREVRAERGSFTDWFAPHDVHVYRFKTRGL